MTEKIDTTNELFQDLLNLTSNYFSIPISFIEKDYWICVILRNLSLSPYAEGVVFKGGTSLSKAFDIIHRFSEDIDFSLIEGSFDGKASDPKKSQKLAQKICKSILPKQFEKDENDKTNTQNSKMYKRLYKFPTLKTYNEGIHSRIIIEITALSNPSPYSKMPITSFIGKYLKENSKSNKKMKEYYDRYYLELCSFELKILDIERTFSEKILAIHKASDIYTKKGDLDFFKKRVRHLYDLFMLSKHDKIQTMLNNKEDFKNILDMSRKDDWTQKDQQGIKIRDFLDILKGSEIFLNPEIIMNKLSKSYQGLASLTINQWVPSEEEIISLLKILHKRF